MAKTFGIIIAHSNIEEVIRSTAEAGFEPIECSIGGKSIVGPLRMDHHGELSGLEGVAIRAYRDHFGACKDDRKGARFVVTGEADADATFAIAALAGELPHPSRAGEFKNYPEGVQKIMTQDLTVLAELVNLMDTAPIGVQLSEKDFGAVLLLWKQMASHVQDETAFYAGVDRWRALLGPARPEKLLLAAINEEQRRVGLARKAKLLWDSQDEKPVNALSCEHWGFDVWYGDHTPVIVWFNPVNNSITVGAANDRIAEAYFGKGGLKNVFPKLDDKFEKGWGGRESIGGSPRGMMMTSQQAKEVAMYMTAQANVVK